MACSLESLLEEPTPSDYALADYTGTDPLIVALAERARCRLAGSELRAHVRRILDANREWLPPVSAIRFWPWPDPSPWAGLIGPMNIVGPMFAGPQPEPPTIPESIRADALEAFAGLLEGFAKDFRDEAATLRKQE